MSVGLFDSGAGGLTILKAVREAFPKLDTFYIGDIARIPYGNKTPEQILQYSLECGMHLHKRYDIEALIIACNTATIYSVDKLSELLPIPVLGAVSPAARHAVEVTNNNKIGVLATKATVNSNAYVEKITQTASSDVDVHQSPCPLFVPLIEDELMLSGEIVDLVVKMYMDKLTRQGVDTVVLGCTHYPLLSSAISKLYPTINLVDSTKYLVKDLKENKINAEEDGKMEIMTTQTSEQFAALAETILGCSNVSEITLEENPL